MNTLMAFLMVLLSISAAVALIVTVTSVLDGAVTLAVTVASRDVSGEEDVLVEAVPPKTVHSTVASILGLADVLAEGEMYGV